MEQRWICRDRRNFWRRGPDNGGGQRRRATATAATTTIARRPLWQTDSTGGARTLLLQKYQGAYSVFKWIQFIYTYKTTVIAIRSLNCQSGLKTPKLFRDPIGLRHERAQF